MDPALSSLITGLVTGLGIGAVVAAIVQHSLKRTEAVHESQRKDL
jgi:F0F1-type ATP synthase membrane subunit c/vacuolar-type H+-ATPase subunit K